MGFSFQKKNGEKCLRELIVWCFEREENGGIYRGGEFWSEGELKGRTLGLGIG